MDDPFADLNDEDVAGLILDETEAVSVIFGSAVARRYNQLERKMKGLPGGLLAGIAASDIWGVIERAIDADSDPNVALDEFLLLEESVT